MITGVHTIVYSRNADADRAFFRDVLGFPHVDAGRGWLIFALPPGEVAVHPAEGSEGHELYLLCEDLDLVRATLTEKGVPCSDVVEARWGRVVRITLPGGSLLGIYQPRHPLAPGMSTPTAAR